jgi:hypothetical protein
MALKFGREMRTPAALAVLVGMAILTGTVR